MKIIPRLIAKSTATHSPVVRRLMTALTRASSANAIASLAAVRADAAISEARAEAS